ncbi:MAG TPA: hypothetical protein VI197_11530, partial [Polyangiaceae bacterium]
WPELRPATPPEPSQPVASKPPEPRSTAAAAEAPAASAPAATAEPEAASERPPAVKERERERNERRAPAEPEAAASAEPEAAVDEASDDQKTDTEGLPEFDRSAAAEALGQAAASAATCKAADGPTGRGRATVTFANSGRATNANVTGAFAGTTVGGCVAELFRQARVPAFSGPPVKVAKSFTVE